MNKEMLKKVMALSAKVGYIFIATANGKGLPHISCARRMELISKDKIAVTEWFCPGTVSNLNENSRVALVVWDNWADAGYQLLGKSQKIEDIAVLDGYTAEENRKSPLPQVERKLSVKVDTIIEFKCAPHSDTEN